MSPIEHGLSAGGETPIDGSRPSMRIVPACATVLDRRKNPVADPNRRLQLAQHAGEVGDHGVGLRCRRPRRGEAVVQPGGAPKRLGGGLDKVDGQPARAVLPDQAEHGQPQGEHLVGSRDSGPATSGTARSREWCPAAAVASVGPSGRSRLPGFGLVTSGDSRSGTTLSRSVWTVGPGRAEGCRLLCVGARPTVVAMLSAGRGGAPSLPAWSRRGNMVHS